MRFLCGVPESTPGAAWGLMVPGGAGVTAGTLWLTLHLLQMAHSEHCLWTTLLYCPIPNQELNEPELWGENCTGSHGACFQSSPSMSSLVASSGVLRWD